MSWLNIVQLGLDFKLNTKIGLDTTTTHHKLLGHFQAYEEAEIWYADFTHKYKIIQGITTKLNPIPQGGGRKSYFPFQRVLGSVRG